ACCSGAKDLAPKPILHEKRQIAGMIEMGVSKQDLMDAFWGHRQRCPVLQTQLLKALKQAAVDETADTIRFDEILRSGNGAGTAEESEFYSHAVARGRGSTVTSRASLSTSF